MICPMLSALQPVDDYGHPVNRECIYEECRFFDLERRDCTLMLASRAMIQAAAETAGREAAPPSPAGPGLEGALTDLRKDLLHSALEVQGVVRESGQALLDRVGAGEGRVADALESLPQRVLGALRGLLDERQQAPAEAFTARLQALERAVGDGNVALRRFVEEGLLTLTTRLDEQAGGLSGSGALAAQMIAQMNALAGTQQRVAETLLEEMSLVQATARKIEQAMGVVEQKTERATEESLQLHQLLTLVKGQAEKTHASLRTINEGNRTVLQAIEAQLQRDRATIAARHREEADACNSRGVLLYYRGALEAALDAFRRAVELQPDYAEAHNNLGLVLSRLRREEEASAAFHAALQADPAMGEALNNLGFLHHAAARFPQAVEMFRKAIDTAADSSVAYTNLGNTYYRMQQPEKAVAAWKRALELDPMNENARRGLRMFQQDPGVN
jgi:tetratricopeptide (TPR) repeat protein